MLALDKLKEWEVVDGHLRDIASRRAALDAEEAHMATHRGTLIVDGDQVLRPNARSHVGPTKLVDTIVRTQARDALVGLGWKPNIARTAVEEAIAHVGGVPVEELIREALRRCPRPAG